MSSRAHPLVRESRSRVSTPSVLACGVCGHHALGEEPVVSAVPEPPRLVCQVCGAHHVPALGGAAVAR